MTDDKSTKEVNYVIHICKNCQKAFLSQDLDNSQILPPDYKNCDECYKLLKTSKYNKEDRKIYKLQDLIANYFVENLDFDLIEYEDFLCSQMTNIFNRELEKTGRANVKSSFKQALEVFSYYSGEERISLKNKRK
jgi:hypothetical protein